MTDQAVDISGLDMEARDAIEAVVGPVANSGMTGWQHYVWACHMLRESDGSFHNILGEKAENYFSLGLLDKHWLGTLDEDTDEAVLKNTSAIVARMAHTLRVFLDEEETTKFLNFVKTNKLPGFAGARLPNLKFPSANCMFEVAFKPGENPKVKPSGDGIDFETLFVRKVTIHCVWNAAIGPSEGEGAPDHLKWAQIVAFVTDAQDQTYTYSGVIQYGQGGAFMFPVWEAGELANAYSGIHPRGVQGERMSHVSQFLCAMIAHLNCYYEQEGGVHYDEGTVEGDFEITTEAEE